MQHRTDALLTIITGLLAVLTGHTVDAAPMKGLGSVVIAVGIIWLAVGGYRTLVDRGRKHETAERR